MRTDQLIRTLAADMTRSRPVAAGFALALAAAAALVAAVALPLLGIRTDLRPALVFVKLAFPLALAAAGAAAALRLARPGGTVGLAALAFVAVPTIIVAFALRELAALPRPDWLPALLGQTALKCLLVVPAMALPLLAAALWALGAGASTRPGLSGVLAGLVSGGVAAAIYALHCIEGSPIFYIAWYGLAILIVTGLGGLAGTRVLRW